jgi:hypothetical protein
MSHTDLADVGVRFLRLWVVFAATPHLRGSMELSMDLKANSSVIRSRHGIYSSIV